MDVDEGKGKGYLRRGHKVREGSSCTDVPLLYQNRPNRRLPCSMITIKGLLILQLTLC